MTKFTDNLSIELKKKLRSAAWRAIVLLGGTAKAAKALAKVGDEVYPQLVSHWLYREQYVPLKHVKFVVKALNGQMTAEEIRPDYF